MSEHTKGPWFPYIHRGKTLTLAIFDSSKSQSDPIVNWLGFDSCSKPDKEKIANAKLIASAPDMHDEITRLLAVEVAAKERDAIVMANARRLIKAKNLTSNGRLYMELFGTGFGTARSRCVKDLGINPESNKTSYDEMMNHISADPALAINPMVDQK